MDMNGEGTWVPSVKDELGAKHTNKHLKVNQGSQTDVSLKPSGPGHPQGPLHNAAIDPVQVCTAVTLSVPLPASLAAFHCSGSCSVQV